MVIETEIFETPADESIEQEDFNTLLIKAMPAIVNQLPTRLERLVCSILRGGTLMGAHIDATAPNSVLDNALKVMPAAVVEFAKQVEALMDVGTDQEKQ